MKEENSSSGQNSPTPVAAKRKKTHLGDKKYLVIQCTGYLKSWALTKMTGMPGAASNADDINDPESCMDSNSCMSCLVAVGRLQPTLDTAMADAANCNLKTVPGAEFSARLTVDGKFAFVDQRVTTMLGFLPQELLGTSFYENVSFDDIPAISEWHRKALGQKEEVRTKEFRFRSRESGRFFTLRAKLKHFRNPWTKELEYLISRFFLCVQGEDKVFSNVNVANYNDINFFGQQGSNGQVMYNSMQPSGAACNGIVRDIQRVITSHAEATKIGRQIADEFQTRTSPSSVVGKNSNFLSKRPEMVSIAQFLRFQRSNLKH